MLIGVYRDVVGGVRGVAEVSPGWRRNLIVSSAWPLVAALLRNEPGLRGILYCAVGEGDQAWDAALPTPTPDTTHLRKETTRVALTHADISYVDAAGRNTSGPSHRLGLSVTIGPVPAPRRLREFGLVGGDATAAAGSGRLLNYAIHPLIELRAGQTLTRMIRLSFRSGGAAAPGEAADVPLHWLGNEPVTVIDGVGSSVAEALLDGEVSNVRELALLDATLPPEGVTISRAVELKAKARLALQTATQLPPVPELNDQTIGEILAGATGASVNADVLDRLHAQLGLLQVALDARRLRRLSLRELREGPP